MDINPHFISIPPYLSVSWDEVTAISSPSEDLIIFHLTNGSKVPLPNLPRDMLIALFSFHKRHLEETLEKSPTHPLQSWPPGFPQNGPIPPIKLAIGGMPGMMQHNPALSEAPPLPEEMLSKISQIVKILHPDEAAGLPKSEPNCHCPHCQIAAAIESALHPKEKPLEDLEVKDEELQFQQWNIEQTGDKLYQVTNKLTPSEKYVVSLGDPLGCTCGSLRCEHLLEVLKH